MRAIGCEMTKLFTVETNDGMTRMNVMTGLIAVPTSARLAVVMKMDENLAKTDEIRDMLFNTNAEVLYAILHMGPPFFSEETAAVVENITIFGQALNNGCIRHLMRSVENLNISERTINILEGERHATNPYHIVSKKQYLRGSITEGQHNLTVQLALNSGNTITIDVGILYGGESLLSWNSGSRIKSNC